jgi:hypothetical protein
VGVDVWLKVGVLLGWRALGFGAGRLQWVVVVAVAVVGGSASVVVGGSAVVVVGGWAGCVGGGGGGGGAVLLLMTSATYDAWTGFTVSRRRRPLGLRRTLPLALHTGSE